MSATYHAYDPKYLTKENLVKNEDFLRDASAFLAERADYDFDFRTQQEEIYNQFMEHFRRQNVNEYTATRDLFHAQNTNDRGREIFGRLMQTYDRMDSDFGFRAMGDYLEGVATAPSTYAGIFSFGAAKAGAVAANQGVKLGIREVLKRSAREKLKKEGLELSAKNISKEMAEQQASKNIFKTAGQKALNYKDGFITGGYKTALGSMAVDAPIAGYTVFQQERTRKKLGLTDDISLKDVAIATAISAVASGAVGAVTGTSRTISSNVAEQIRNVAIAKETNGINTVNRTITKNTFKSKKTGKDANKILDSLKMSLKESVPELLEEGKKIKKAGMAGDAEFGQIGYGATLDQKLHENIASAAAQILQKVPPKTIDKLVKDKKTGKVVMRKATERITSRMSRGLKEGYITDVEIFKILDAHQLSMKQLAALMAEEYSAAGSLLQKAGAVAKLEKNKILKELTEVDQKLIALSDVVTPATAVIKKSGILGQGGKLANLYDKWLSLKAIDKASIGLMTIQTATTARNTQNGYMRNITYALDNLGAGFAYLAKGAGEGLVGLTSKQIRDEAFRSVKMAQAHARTGVQSLLGKDLWLGTKSWETEALELLFRDERFAKSKLARELFKEMGDIGELTGEEGGLLWIARKANFLNTLSDNMFKRAVFSKEIDKYLYASGQRGGLKGFFEDQYLDPLAASTSVGKFSLIDDKAIGKAMQTALEQTYQTGKFREKAGIFNKVADTFINVIQNTPFIGTAVAPFPRYLVNQFIFAYEHMPILGVLNFGGILNKEAGKKGYKGIRVLTDEVRLAIDPETFGKQISGLSMLAGFTAIRHHFGDESTGPYEINNPFGTGTINLQAALGPYLAFAYVADMIYRHTGPNRKFKNLPQLHDNDKIAVDVPRPTRELIQAFTGGQGRAGTGLYIVDEIVDYSINASESGEFGGPKVQEAFAKYIGNLFNRATVSAGMLKDIAGIFLDPNYRVLKDNSSVDFMEYMWKQAFRSFPDKYEPENGDVPVYDPTRRPEKPVQKINPLLKIITGYVEEPDKNVVKFELDRLKFDYREVAPMKIQGDSPASNLAKMQMGIYADTEIRGYILGEDYRNLPTDKLKRMFLKELINEKRRQSRAKVLAISGEETIKEKSQKFKNLFYALPETKRDVAAYAYKQAYGVDPRVVVFPDGRKGHWEEAMRYYTIVYGKTDEDLVKVTETSERKMSLKGLESKFTPN